MSEAVSTQIMRRLREEARKLSRPAERERTLDRLEAACNAIASGKAKAIIKDGLPDADVNFRRSPTLVKPPRVEEYILAMKALDVRARRIPSGWTGPMATTIRKDPKGLLEYVRTREAEQSAQEPGKIRQSVEDKLDKVEDLGLRSELRFELARARQAQQDLSRLREAMRTLRPTFDIDAVVKGERVEKSPGQLMVPKNETRALESDKRDGANMVLARAFVEHLTKPSFLVKFGLVFDEELGLVQERATLREFIAPSVLAALRAVTGAE